jgi:hypothetical protein
MRTTMNLPTVRKRWKGGHAHAVAKGMGRCRCESRFVVSRWEGTAQEEEDLGEKKSPYVKNDDGSVARSTRNGTKSVVVLGCWVAAPEGAGKNDCSSMNAYGNGSCPSLSVELLVGVRAVKWKRGTRTLGMVR